MLHEMGKSLFPLGLHQRSDIHPHPDRYLSRWHPVALDRIAQAIVQFAKDPALVDRHITVFI